PAAPAYLHGGTEAEHRDRDPGWVFREGFFFVDVKSAHEQFIEIDGTACAMPEEADGARLLLERIEALEQLHALLLWETRKALEDEGLSEEMGQVLDEGIHRGEGDHRVEDTKRRTAYTPRQDFTARITSALAGGRLRSEDKAYYRLGRSSLSDAEAAVSRQYLAQKPARRFGSVQDLAGELFAEGDFNAVGKHARALVEEKHLQVPPTVEQIRVSGNVEYFRVTLFTRARHMLVAAEKTIGTLKLSAFAHIGVLRLENGSTVEQLILAADSTVDEVWLAPEASVGEILWLKTAVVASASGGTRGDEEATASSAGAEEKLTLFPKVVNSIVTSNLAIKNPRDGAVDLMFKMKDLKEQSTEVVEQRVARTTFDSENPPVTTGHQHRNSPPSVSRVITSVHEGPLSLF
ncbi:unnamed protein product, partial [Amoebophrya sp. A120]